MFALGCEYNLIIMKASTSFNAHAHIYTYVHTPTSEEEEIIITVWLWDSSKGLVHRNRVVGIHLRGIISQESVGTYQWTRITLNYKNLEESVMSIVQTCNDSWITIPMSHAALPSTRECRVWRRFTFLYMLAYSLTRDGVFMDITSLEPVLLAVTNITQMAFILPQTVFHKLFLTYMWLPTFASSLSHVDLVANWRC